MPTVAEIRKKFPSLSGASDDEVVDTLHRNFYSDLSRDDVAKSLGVKLQPEPEKSSSSGVMRRVLGDSLMTAGKMAVGVPEAAVGIADLVTGGEAGRLAEQAGFRPKEAKAILNEGYTPEQKAAFERVQKAEGFFGTLGEAVKNPSVIAHTVGESLGLMGAAGVAGRGLKLLGAGPVTAGAAGEGLFSAGSTAEAVRQESPDGSLSGEQAALSAGSGALTGLITRVSGARSQRRGIGDVDTLFVQGLKSADPVVVKATQDALLAQTKKHVVRKIVEGVVTEGGEELLQSYQEQIAQNVATGRPWDEGLDQAAVLGMLAGSVMGGAAAPFGGAPHAMTDPPGPRPGDPLREAKMPESGPMSRAVNAGIEGEAKAVDNNAPLPAGLETEGAAPAAQFVGTELGGRLAEVRSALGNPDVRQAVHDTFGAQGLIEATYYANIADRNPSDGSVPMRTRLNLVGVAEQILQRAAAIRSRDGLVQDMPAVQPALPAPAGGMAQLEAPPATPTGPAGSPPMLPMDTARTGNLVADQDGNVRPELRREVVNRDVERANQDLAQELRIQQEQAAAGAAAELGLGPGQGAAPRSPELGSVQPGDIQNELGKPFRNKRAAEVVARREGGNVVAVPEGWVVRRGDGNQPGGAAPGGTADAGAVPGNQGVAEQPGAADDAGQPVVGGAGGGGAAGAGPRGGDGALTGTPAGEAPDGGSATVADPPTESAPTEPAGEGKEPDGEEKQGQAPDRPEGGDQAPGADRTGGGERPPVGPGTPTGGQEPASPPEAPTGGQDGTDTPAPDGNAPTEPGTPAGGQEGGTDGPAGSDDKPTQQGGGQPQGEGGGAAGPGTPGGQPPKEPKPPREPKEPGEKKPPKPPKTDRQKLDEEVAALLEGSDAKGLAERIYKGLRDPQPADHPQVFAEDKLIRWPEVRNGSMAESMFFHLRQGWWPADNNALKEFAAKAFRVESKSLDLLKLKQAQEDFEAALARYAGHRIEDMRKTGADDRAVYNYLVELYQKQPNLDVRTSDSAANQAYSTPLPIGYVSALLTRLAASQSLFDPTGGNGMLAFAANPRNVVTIELDPKRANNMRLMQVGKVIEGDATKLIDSDIKDQQTDVVHSNPPFGSLPSPGIVKSWDGRDFHLGKIDHLIAAKAMKAMADKGRAIIILGAHRNPGTITSTDRVFLNWLYSNYHVADHFEVDGKLYSRQGAGWPIRVLVVAGRQQTVSAYTGTSVDRVYDFDQLWERYGQAAERSRDVLVGAGKLPEDLRGPAPDDGADGVPPGADGQGGGSDREGGGEGAGDGTGGPGAPGGSDNGGKPGGTGAGTPGGGMGGGRGPRTGGGGGGGSRSGGGGRRGAGSPEPGGLSGLSDDDIDRLLGDATSGQGGGGKSGKTGGSSAPRGPRTPKEAGGASKTVLDDIDGIEDIFGDIEGALGDPGDDPTPPGGGRRRSAFSRPVDDDKYAKFLPAFERLWAKLSEVVADIAQRIRRFAAGLKQRFGDAIVPFAARFLRDQRDAESNVPSEKKPIIADHGDTETMVAYRGRSTGSSGGIYVPRSQADALQHAFDNFEAKHGEVDPFVQKELGYESIEQMKAGLGGYQIDALALSIASMKEGNGFIIGDDTGVGKGRTAAGLITWAINQGKVPIFFSFKRDLYSDMWGDLRDIGKRTDNILATDTDAEIVDKKNNNRLVFRNNSKINDEIKSVAEKGELPAGRKALFTTYYQVQTPGPRQRALQALIKSGKAVIIMDESHNAAGDSNRADFIEQLLTGKNLFGDDTDPPEDWNPPPTVYLSATFAKRADNMPLYQRTHLRHAANSPEDLVALFKGGGDVLLKTASEMLVKAGSMIRRERSYEGVKFGYYVDESNAPRDARLVDEVTAVLRQIVYADRAFNEWATGPGAQEVMKLVPPGFSVGGAGSRADVAMNKNPFTSVVHNCVGQLLLATKIQTSVEKAVAALNAGTKPVLTLQNTMEAALEDYASNENLKAGDELENFGWQSVLQRGLLSARRVSFKSGTGNAAEHVRVIVPMGMIPGLIQREFARTQSLIDKFQSALPASPIDAIKHELSKYWVVEKADGAVLVTKTVPDGAKARRLKVEEVTGRQMAVDYSGETLRYVKRTRPETNDVVTDFQNGAIDVMILNSSGSTGLSLHASEFAKDQRPRHMIILQPNPDVSVFKQTIGRIHRTGQVEWPSFEVLATGIPAERRALAVMRKKLKTLFSNTSSGKGSTELEAVDFINEYGDKIVKSYLDENDDVAKFIGLGNKEKEDLALTASGRAALLAVTEQSDFFDTIEQQFKDEIAMRDATGTNALERRELDLQATFEDQNVLEEGMDEENPFTSTAYIARAKINIIGDIPEPDGVRAAVAKTLNGRKASQIVDEIETALKVPYDEALNQQNLQLAELKKQAAAPEATEKEKEAINERIKSKEILIRDFGKRREKTINALRTTYYVGSQFDTVNIGDVEASGVVVGITVSKITSKGGNPYSPSHFRIAIARNVPNGRVEIPLSKIESQTSGSDIQVMSPRNYRDNIDEWFALKNVAGGREERYIASGNLLRARAVLKGAGEMILHTMMGSTPQAPRVQGGIRLPAAWQPSATAASDLAIRYPGAAVDIVLATMRASLQERFDRYGDEAYGKRIEAIDALTKHAPKLTMQQASPIAQAGLYGSNRSWTLVVSGYDGGVQFSVRDQAVATNKGVRKALEPMQLAKKRGRDWWALDGNIASPDKVAALLRALSRLGPVMTSSDHKDVVAPIIKAHFNDSNGGGKPAAARSAARLGAGGGMDARELKGVAFEATARWENAPKVIVVESMDDPAIPKRVRKEFEAQNAGGAEGSPAGFFDGGKVYLVANGLSSAAEARRIIAHEALGHYGLRGLYGESLNGILDQIARAQPAKVRAMADAYGLDLQKLDDRRQAAEEVLAKMAEDTPELGFVRRLLAAVRSFLRRIGWREVGLSNDEIIRDYILPARAWVERGPGGGGGGGIRFARARADDGDRPAFSRGLAQGLAAGVNGIRDLRLPAGYVVNDFITSHGKLSWWQKTVGTPYNLAEKNSSFKRVFDRVQAFLGDISQYATDAADKAPTILPKLDKLGDILKTPIEPKDSAALAAPVFQGTLLWKRDKYGLPELADKVDEAGIVWTREELRDRFKLTDKQADLYFEFRSAVDESLRSLAISDMLRIAGKDAAPLAETIMELDVDSAAQRITDRLAIAAASDSAGRAAELTKAGEQVLDKARKAKGLMERGYAPLSRYGTHAVDAVDADGDRLYFGLFETQGEANKMARKLRQRFPDAKVDQGTMATEKWRMFAGVSPETVELFGEIIGLDSLGDAEKDKAFQEYIRLAKSNRSSMKRMLERKGVEGFSDDVGRVLAGFVYSNARQTAANLHLGEIGRAVNDIPKEQGETSNYAVNMVDYVRNPVEEAQAARSVLFAQYIGGSVASAIVNLTQPIAVAFPYLSQFGGAAKAARALTKAVADMANGSTGDAKLDAALKDAEESGVVSPQEIFQLMAQAQGRGALKSGDGTFAGNAAAAVNNGLSRIQLAWGKPFAMAELINRRMTFIAAYRMAPAGQDPAKFASKAVQDTQFVYNKGNRPKWARGVLGSLAFTFKMYSVSYIELLGRMAGSGPEGRKALLIALAVMLLLGGADGLPFMQDADDVIDGIMQRLGFDFSLKESRRDALAALMGKELAEYAARGVSGIPGAPIDIANRLGMGNLVPATGVFLKKTDYTRDVTELAGPMADFVQRTFKATGQAMSARSPEDVLKAATTLSPIAAQNWAKAADMVRTGMYRDDRGRKVIDSDLSDAAAKFIGFQPNNVAKVQDAAAKVQRSVALAKTVESEIVQEWAQGLFEDSVDKVERARAKLRTWNENNPETPIRISATQIRKRVMGMREDRKTRLEKTAPPEIRARVREELAS